MLPAGASHARSRGHPRAAKPLLLTPQLRMKQAKEQNAMVHGHAPGSFGRAIGSSAKPGLSTNVCRDKQGSERGDRSPVVGEISEGGRRAWFRSGDCMESGHYQRDRRGRRGVASTWPDWTARTPRIPRASSQPSQPPSFPLPPSPSPFSLSGSPTSCVMARCDPAPSGSAHGFIHRQPSPLAG
jgi:hypothetical protein